MPRLERRRLNAISRLLRQSLFYLFCLIGFSAWATPSPVVDIAGPLNGFDTRSALEVLIDPSSTLTLEDVLVASPGFRPASRWRYTRCDCAIWTKLSLRNGSSAPRQVLVLNAWPFINQLDFHVLRQDGEQELHQLGSLRRHLETRIPHRYDVQPVLLAPGETVAIYARHTSRHAINIGIELHSLEHFVDFSQRDAQIWGIFSGLVAAMILYNIVVGLALQQKVFLIYVVHGLTTYFFTVLLMGDSIVAWLKPILLDPDVNAAPMSSETAAHVSRLLTCGVSITGLLFARSFFDLRRTMPQLARLSSGWLVLAIAIMGGELMSLWAPGFNWAAIALLYFVPVFLISWLGFALYMAWRALPGSALYLAGSGSFIIMAMLQDIQWLGYPIPLPSLIAAYGIPIGLMLELAFLAVAIGQKIGFLKQEHEVSQRLLMEQAKFVSVGQLSSSVVHQLKRPLIYAGTQLMKLEALAEKPVGIWPQEMPKAIGEMRQTIEFMDKTIVDLYHFYAADRTAREFCPAIQIEQALRIITPMTTGSALKVEARLLHDAQIHGEPNAFAQVMLIVLENAAQVLKERQVASPCIRLSMAIEKDLLHVRIEDNGGGVSIHPPERIFDLSYRDGSHTGMGVGLALAKRLMEEKLHGRITVRNGPQGAVFTLTLPVRQSNKPFCTAS